MVDLEKWLRDKQGSIDRARAAAVLGDSEAVFAAERAKGPDADPEVLHEHFHRIAMAIHPNRADQVRRQLADGLGGGRMLAVCDFAQIPFTFDMLVFLFVADKARREAGLDKLDVAFVAQASDPGIDDPPAYQDLARNFRTLVHNLGMEGTRLIPSIGSVLFFDNRRSFQDFFAATRENYAVYPSYYHPPNPVYRMSTAE